MMKEEKCPIWNTPAVRLDGYSTRDDIAVISPRAGGKYFITRSAQVSLRSLGEEELIKLTHEIVTHNMVDSVAEINTATIDGICRAPKAKPSQRATRLLEYLVSKSRYLGEELSGFSESYTENTPSAFFISSRASPKADPLLAWSDSINADEVLFLLNMLSSSQAVQLDSSGPVPSIVVLPAGYDQAAASTVISNSDQAFVAMWFDVSMEAAYENGIEKAIRHTGYRPMRIDRKEHINKVDDEIISEIRKSKFVVADFTSAPKCPRGGVYFEAGFALALGLPVIWSVRADSLEDVHFDTRQFNHLVWTDPEQLNEMLSNRIGAVVGQGPFA